MNKKGYTPPKGHGPLHPDPVAMVNELRGQLGQEFQTLAQELGEIRATLAGLLVVAEKSVEGERFDQIRELELGPRIAEFQKTIGNIWWNVPEEKFYKIPTYASEFKLKEVEGEENTWLGVNELENIEWTIKADNQQEAYNMMMDNLNKLILEERARMEAAAATEAEATKAVEKKIPVTEAT